MDCKYMKLSFVIAFALTLSACGAAEDGAVPASADATAGASSIQGKATYVGTSLGRYVDPATLLVTGVDESFTTSDRLFAAVNLQDASVGTTVAARLIDAKGNVLARRDAVTSGAGQTHVNFDFDVPSKLVLQPGEYSVDVAINESQVGNTGFRVK